MSRSGGSWGERLARWGRKWRRGGKGREPFKTRSLRIEPLEIRQLLAIVSISPDDPTATEQGPTTGQFTVTRTDSTANDLTVYYSAGGTADYYMEPDYSGLPNFDGMGSGWLTIPAGSSNATFAITPIDDSFVESDETVTLTLSSDAGYTVGTPADASITITDNDALAEVSITASDPTAAEEGTATGQFTVTRTGDTANDLAVYYSAGGTADFYMEPDYSGLPNFDGMMGEGWVTIPAGYASTTITVTPIDDAIVESNETVTVTLSSDAGYAMGTPTSASVTITDDDTLADVSITASDPSASEQGAATGQFTVTRTGDTASDLAVYYSVGGTADYYMEPDYSGLPNFDGMGGGWVTIPAGYASTTITIAPIDDAMIESNETVTLTLSADSGYTVGTPASASVTIADNDALVEVSMAAPVSTASEEGPAAGQFTLTRTGGTASDLTVYYTVGGTADYYMEPDYSGLPNFDGMGNGWVTIPAGYASTTITVTPIDDAFVESDETITLTLSSGAGYTAGAPSTATVTIADNDVLAEVTVVATDATATESGPTTGQFSVTRTGSTANSLDVQYWVSGTADYEMEPDYAGLPNFDGMGNGWVTIPAGQSSAVITITPIDDAVAEDSETVALSLSVDAGYTVGTPGAANLTIDDNDGLPEVTITATEPAAAEEGTAAGVFTVTRTGSTGSALTVFYSAAGTADYDVEPDYSGLTNFSGMGDGWVTIAPGDFSAVITITPIDDALVESDETVTLTLTSDAGYTVGTPTSASVTIADNDVLAVSITASDSTATEEGTTTGEFTVTRTGGTATDLIVHYSVGGTADYDAEPDYSGLTNFDGMGGGWVTIPMGSSSTTITITPIDDATVESDETVTLTLSSDAGYTVGTPDSASVTIGDDDGLSEVTVVASDAIATETGTTTGEFTVTRTGSTAEPLEVNYWVSGTASYDTDPDYSGLPNFDGTGSGWVTIPAGLYSTVITIAPLDDAIAEGDESVALSLSADAGYTVGTPGAANLTIEDDDGLPEVTIAATDPTAIEAGAETGQFTVTRTGSTASTLTVFYSVGGTADYSPDVDYSGLPNLNGAGAGWVTIPAGYLSTVITITPVDDGVAEGDETVVLTLSSDAGYTLGTLDAATVTVSDQIPGPYVTGVSPSGDVFGPVDRLELTFNEPVQDGTFTLDDVVTLTGPSGAISATAVNKLTDTQYEVVFPSQTASGTYTLAVGPEILNGSGVAMDQDQDTVSGEGVDDRYTATVTIANSPPVVVAAIPDQTVDEDATDTTIDLSSVFDDSDVPSGDGLTYEVHANSDPSVVSVTVLGTSLVLDYLDDQHGAVDLTIRATDTRGEFVDDTFLVTVNSVNDAPVAANDTLGAIQDVAVNVDVLSNDADGDGDPVSITVLSATHGAAVVNDAGTPADPTDDTVDFTPETGFYGTAEFTYRLNDGTADSNTATVTITVDAPPVAADDTASTSEDTAAGVDVLLNDTDADGDPLWITLVDVTHGTAVVNDAGTPADPTDDTVDFTPEADFFGTAEFTYRVDDGTVDSQLATVTVTVDAVNDAPVAADETVTTNIETAVNVDVLSNDGDVEGDPLWITILSSTHGTAVVNDGGTPADPTDDTVDFSPEAGFSGSAGFGYQLNDGLADSNTATVAVLVNDPPTAVDDAAATNVDVATGVDVLLNDTDADGDPLWITLVDVTHGTAVVNDAGTPADPTDDTVDFTPEAGFYGAAEFTYRLNDGMVDSLLATVTVTVNVPPTAVADSAATDEDVAVVVDVLANDSDTESDPLWIVIVGATHGAAAVNDGGTPADPTDDTVDFTSEADFFGTAEFTYRLSDGVGESEAVAVTVAVSPLPDAPVAVDDAIAVSEGGVATVLVGGAASVLANDTDADLPGDSLSVETTPVSGPAYGVLTLNADGSFSYTHDGSENFGDSFTYRIFDGDLSPATATVTITITPANDNAPAFTSPAAASVVENTTAVLTVQATDADLPAQTIVYSITGGADQARFAIDSATGELAFQPAPDYEAPADADGDNVYLVEVTADDQAGQSTIQSIDVTVTAINDLPVLDLDADDSSGATGADYAGAFVENDGPVAVADVDAVLADADDANFLWLTVTLASYPDGADESLSADVAGTSIEAAYADGVLTLSGEDTALNYQQVLGTVYYNNTAAVPDTTDRSIAIVAGNAGGTSATATAVLTVALANDRPIGTEQGVTTAEDTSLAITLAGEDGDPEVAQTLGFILFAEPSHGTLSDFDPETGALTYTPDADFVGEDTIQFVVVDDDTAGGEARYSVPTTVTITVTAVNDAPLAESQTLGTGVDVPLTIDLGDDGDPEVVQALSYAVVVAPGHGTLSAFDPATGEILYTPDAGYLGDDTFSVTLTDDATAGDPAGLVSGTATIDVTVAYEPVADAQSVATSEDTAVAITLTGDDGDPGAAHDLTFAIVAEPSYGTVSGFDSATGQFTYTPDENLHGTDSLSFTVAYTTASGAVVTSAPAEVQIDVSATNDAPQAASQEIRTGQETAVVFDLGEDGDPETEQTLTLTVITAPAHGTLSGFDAVTGEVTYTPEAGFLGADSFSYTLTDDATAGDPAGLVSVETTVTIAVVGPPTADSQAAATDEDTSALLALTGDDGDASSVQELTFVILDGPLYGSLGELDAATGEVTYTPDEDYNGTDSFTFAVQYVASGGVVLASSAATVQLTVTPVNDEPERKSRMITLAPDAAITLDLGDDGDPEVEQQLTLTVVTSPSHGTLSDFDPLTGEVLYTPEAGYTGTDVFTFTLTDDAAAGQTESLTCHAGEIAISIEPPPTATPQAVTTDEDSQLSVTLTGQTGNPEGTALRFSIVREPQHGTLVDFDAETGQATYVPDADFNGEDTFRFEVTEYDTEDFTTGLTSERALVTITVAAVNDAPQGTDQIIATGKETAIEVTFAGEDGDSDVEQTLTFAILTQPGHGTISDFDPVAGTFTYTPESGYHGTDSFTFTVTDDTTAGGAAITSEAATVDVFIGAPPVADPQTTTTEEDTATTLTLTGADGDPQDEAALRFLIVTAPAHGRITAFDQLTGEVTYLPDADYVGADSFSFALIDDLAGPDLPLEGPPAVVGLTVTAANDAPTALDGEVAVAEDTWRRLVLGWDGDPEVEQVLALNVTSGPSHGTLSDFDSLTGEVKYTPEEGYVGDDSFTFTLSDDATAGGPGSLTSDAATVTITVTAANHAPVADPQSVSAVEDTVSSITLTGSDGDAGVVQTLTYQIVRQPGHGELTGFDPTTGQVDYTPEPGYVGDDSFFFVVIDDDGVEDSRDMAGTAAEVSITVTSVNDAPSAEPLDVTLAEDEPVVIQLVGDDGDEDTEQTLTFTITVAPSHGTISDFDSATGQLTYTPEANYDGPDGFSYTVTDDATAGGAALTSAAETVSLSITAVHWAAVAQPLAVTTVKGQALDVELSSVGNADPVQDLTYAIVAGPGHGTLSGLDPATGQVAYTPETGFTGADSFTFSVTDNASTAAATTAIVFIQVNDVTATAVANDDSVTVRESDGEALLDVLANDTFDGAGSLNIISATSPDHGAVSIVQGDPQAIGAAARDRLSFVPEAGYTGAQTISYTIEDGSSNQSTASLTITVGASGTVATGGAVSIAGTGFDPQPESTFTPPVTGTTSTSSSLSGEPYSTTWTASDGETVAVSGTESTTTMTTSTSVPSGGWTYSETVTWSYDVMEGSVHLWGGYVYTFSSCSVGGTEFFVYSFASHDFYSVSSTDSYSGTDAGYSTTYSASGSRHDTAFMFKSVTAAGESATANFNRVVNTSYTGAGSYWYSTPGGTFSGSNTSGGSTFDMANVSVAWTYVAATDTWIAVGNALALGFGGDHGSHNGSGTYTIGAVSGSINESGSWREGGSYMVNGTLGTDFEWDLLGTAQSSGNGSSRWSYAGSGSYTNSGSGTVGEWSISGSVAEDGGYRNSWRNSMHASLVDGAWEATSGSGSGNNASSSAYLHSGTGTYTSSSASGGDSYTMSGSVDEYGSYRTRDQKSVSSTYNGTTWTDSGSGSGYGQSVSYHGFSGIGTFANTVPGGTVSGTRREIGYNIDSEQRSTTSTLGADGNWLTSGSGSGSGESYTFSGFSGVGSYTRNHVTGTAKQNGWDENQTSSIWEWDLPTGGAWTLVGGSGSGSTASYNSNSHDGSGTYSAASSIGPRVASMTITRNEGGGGWEYHKSEIQTEPISGRWVTTSGTALTSGAGSANTDYSGSGGYHYTRSGATVTGTASASGGSTSSNDYETTGSWDPGAPASGGGTGAWVTTGTRGADDSGFRNESYSGSGGYSLSTTSTAPGGHTSWSTAAGTVTEDGSNNSSWSSEWDENLTSDGEWTLASGSGTSTGNGHSNFKLETNDSYGRSLTTPTVSSTVGGTATTLRQRNHHSSYTGYSDVIDGDWAWVDTLASGSTSSSGSAGGSVLNESTRTGTGTYTFSDGTLLLGGYTIESHSDHDQFNYDKDSSVGADHAWHTTGTADENVTTSFYYEEGTLTGTYERDVAGGTVSGGFYNSDVDESNSNFTGNYAYDEVESEWDLTGGTGSTYAGEGIGQGFSGDGGYSLSGSYAASTGEDVTWSLSGDITESGSRSLTLGETTNYEVADGVWDVSSTNGSGTIHGASTFSNDATGTYNRGAVSGSFTRSMSHVTGADFSFTVSGSGAGLAGGDGDQTNDYTSSWSYSESGDSSYGGLDGTRSENGGGYSNSSVGLSFELDEDESWQRTSGTRSFSQGSNASADFLGDSTDSASGTEEWGSWSVTYTDSLNVAEGYSQDVAVESEWSDDGWGTTSTSESFNDYYSATSAYADDGSYTAVFDGGSVSGDQTAGGHNHSSYNFTWVEEVTPTSSDHTKEATTSTSNGSCTAYGGTGSYVYGAIFGDFTEGGHTSYANSETMDYEYSSGAWHVHGTGGGSRSNGWNYSFGGTGTYTGGTVSGTQSENGFAEESHSSGWETALGEGGRWVLSSGTGLATKSSNYDYSAGGTGSYSAAFDGGTGALHGTLSNSFNRGWSYSASSASEVHDQAWVTSGDGSYYEYSGNDQSYAGSGAYSIIHSDADGSSEHHASFDESGSHGSSNQYEFNWSWDPSGMTSDAASTSTGYGSAAYSRHSSGDSDYTTITGDYAGGNGVSQRNLSNWDHSISESYSWTSEHESWENTDADGTVTRGSYASGTGAGAGSVHRSDYQLWEASSVQTSTGDVDYYHAEYHMSGSTWDLTDDYSYTGSWDESGDSDGTVTHNSTLSNHVTGSRTGSGVEESSWETTVTYHGSASGGADETTHDEDATSDPWTSPTESYDFTFDDSVGFHESTYTGVGDSFGSAPCSGTGTYVIEGETSGEDPGSDSGDSGSGSTSSTVDSGGWYVLAGGGGDDDGDSLIVGCGGAISAGAGGETTFGHIVDIKQYLPGMEPAASPYDEMFEDLVGEALEGLTGAEATADLGDVESFLGEAASSTTATVGSSLGGPGGTLAGMGIDSGAGGATMSAGYEVTHEGDGSATAGDSGDSGHGGSFVGTAGDASLSTAAFGTGAAGISTTSESTRPETFTVSETDALGRTTEYTYASGGRLTKITEPDPDGDGPRGPLTTTLDYDDRGNLTEIHYADGTSESLTYHEFFAVPTSYTDALGRVTKYTVDDTGQTTAVTLVVGQDDDASSETDDLTYLFTYSDGSGSLPFGLLLTETDPLGRVTQYTYEDDTADSAFGELVAVTYAVGTVDEATVQFEYGSGGVLTAEIDELGRRTEYEYDFLGRMVLVRLPDPDGEGPLSAPVTRYWYDDTTDTVTITDPLGNVTVETYDADDRLVQSLLPDPDGEGPLAAPVAGFTYDTEDNLTSAVDPLGRVTSYTYDALDRLTQVTLPDPDGEGPLSAPTTVTTYDAAGNVSSTTDPTGAVTQYEYDARHRLIRVIEPDPDGAGPLESQVTEAQYDAAGQLTAVIDPLGRVVTFTYDDLGQRIAMTLPDPDGEGPLSAPEYTYTYDAVGNLLTETDPESNTTQYEYDHLNRLIRVTDADGEATEYQYDAAGQMTAVTDPLSQTTTYTYDNLGRRIGMTLPDPDGEGPLTASEYSYSFDAAGNLASETDPEGNVTQYEYDALGRLVTVTDAEGGVTQYAYDAAGNRLSLNDPVDNTTTWVYDGLDRVVEETNEWGDSRYYAYDSVGNLVSYTDRNGRVTEYAYDDLHRLVEERWLDGQTVIHTIAYTYDAAGQLLGVDDAEADYTYAYDALGRATSSSLNLAGLGQTVTLSYAYDSAGRRAELSATIDGTDDFLNSYAYDATGRLVRVEQSGVTGGNAVAEKRVDFTYDSSGRTSTIIRYADLAATQLVAATNLTYDSAGRLTSLIHSQDAVDLVGYTWTYDSAGRITQFTSLLDGTVTYTHDATGQLTGADYDYQDDESYTYDANGNRTSGGCTTGTNNQLLSDGTFWYEYDAEGNRTLRYVWTDTDVDGEVDPGEQSEITEYEWDHRNRLVGVVERDSNTGPATQTVEHTYDYVNRWVARSVDPDGDGPLGFDNTYFVYDGTPSGITLDRAAVSMDEIGQIVLQFDDDAQGTPQLTHRYLWGAAVDQILADEQVTDLLTAGEILWPLTDHLGTVRDLAVYDAGTDTTTVANHRVYDAFGKLVSETNAAVDHLFAFTGRALDKSTGLQNNLNRWYDAEVGRWLSLDPIAFAAGDTNLSRYVGNSPESLTDPNGLNAVTHFLSDYWYYLTHPGSMDKGYQIAQKAALGLSVGAASAAAVIVAAPAAATAGAAYLWGTAGCSATTAVTVSSGTVTAALFGLGIYGGLNLATSSIAAYQQGDWNQLAYNGGLMVGGLLAAPGARPALSNRFPSVTKPSSAPPMWRPIATLKYEYAMGYNSELGAPGLGWLATAPTPAAGAGAMALGAGIWVRPVDPHDWLGIDD